MCEFNGVLAVQKRPTTQPRDYITAFKKNFPNVKVRLPLSCDSETTQCLNSQEGCMMNAACKEQGLLHLTQGGTCILAGDTPSRVAEAAQYAQKLIGCKIMKSAPYYRQDGHVQVCTHTPGHVIWASWACICI